MASMITNLVVPYYYYGYSLISNELSTNLGVLVI